MWNNHYNNRIKSTITWYSSFIVTTTALA